MKQILKNKTLLVLCVLIVVGFFLRVYRLEQVPLYGDELTIALDVNSLLHTGRDQTGEVLPLTFSMGAGRPAGYVYGSIPFVAFFGVNEWGVRGLSIFSGLLLIVLMYLLGKRLFNEKVGLLAATLFTFSFWDISLSRGGYEAHFALLLALGGIVSALFADQKKWLLLIVSVCFGLTFHTYPTYKVVLPLFLLSLGYYLINNYKKVIDVKNKLFLSSLSLFFLISIFAVIQTFTGGSENRFLTINVFSDTQIQEMLTQKINEERTASELPFGFEALFHNRALENIKLVGQNYLHNLSWDFLFLYGDKNPRHNMATMGYFYLVEILTITFGLIYLLIKRYGRLLSLLLIWILVAPVATALITDPHGLRSAFLVPPLVLLSAIGVNYLWELCKMKHRYLLGAFLVILFFFQFIYFSEKLYFVAPQLYGGFWADEGKYASEKALENKNNYQYVIISDKIDSIEYAYPVYGKVSADEVINQHTRSELLVGTQGGFKKFDNVYIGNPTEETLRSLPSLLYIGPIEEQDRMENYVTVKNRNSRDILVVGQPKI